MFTENDGVHYFLYVGIQVYGPGPSRFYQPTFSQPVTQQAISSQTVTSTENGSTTKVLTVC